ncbi:MAG: Lrp/AsnC family transcriptional regulator [Kiritimatiellia bacterium]|jgi:DNA-binding Lrp family transcriptional regulator|nr:Lrp/AsnC family transcriptional regulator [Kiritimatiellia bacterium]MDP6630851.1 Lrp/AsnC family transcriptional regulator [Kiritimatiellia bacterium]MDP6811270.1 Lrp/AsnC family transcriptional regulator [Kiritimatiellia bacterium]MDP7024116.1 Lrp/AsnC family transcriptional regulator [Kiritimatiellia bacterium]
MDKLLKLLQENALETPENLAKMLDLSVEDVKAQIAAYEQKGIICGYRAIVNEDQLDIDKVRAVIEVKITPERGGGYDRIASRISRFEQVDSLFLMSGTYDLLVFVVGRTLHEVATFVNEQLATIAGVLSTTTHFSLKTYKDQGVLMKIEDDHERLKVTP